VTKSSRASNVRTDPRSTAGNPAHGVFRPPEKGIYYEAARERYRVRLYKHNAIVFRQYFKTYEEAQACWKLVVERVRTLPPNETIPSQPTPINLLAGLQATSTDSLLNKSS
jgi:hypothetical protein